uniref:p-11 n=1 Tax=Galleria mellonella TaxID=7137 RepID=A0A385JDC4_GALME|nr:P-11 [Galleria mellonella]
MSSFGVALVFLTLYFIPESKAVSRPVYDDDGHAPGGYQFGDGYIFQTPTPVDGRPSVDTSLKSLARLQSGERQALKDFLKMLQASLNKSSEEYNLAYYS